MICLDGEIKEYKETIDGVYAHIEGVVVEEIKERIREFLRIFNTGINYYTTIVENGENYVVFIFGWINGFELKNSVFTYVYHNADKYLCGYEVRSVLVNQDGDYYLESE